MHQIMHRSKLLGSDQRKWKISENFGKFSLIIYSRICKTSSKFDLNLREIVNHAWQTISILNLLLRENCLWMINDAQWNIFSCFLFVL